MNIIEKIDNNFFFKELFPSGIEGDIFVGNIELRTDKRMFVDIHTTQKPNKEIKKWGVWGGNYNTIVIEILIDSIKKSEIINWQKAKPCQIQFSYEENLFSILFSGNDWYIFIKADAMLFQRCSVYINSMEDDEQQV